MEASGRNTRETVAEDYHYLRVDLIFDRMLDGLDTPEVAKQKFEEEVAWQEQQKAE